MLNSNREETQPKYGMQVLLAPVYNDENVGKKTLPHECL